MPLTGVFVGQPYSVNGITDSMQADYLVRSSGLSLAGGVAGLYGYDARDLGTESPLERTR